MKSIKLLIIISLLLSGCLVEEELGVYPSLEIISPEKGAEYKKYCSVPISFKVSDDDGEVKYVEVFIDNFSFTMLDIIYLDSIYQIVYDYTGNAIDGYQFNWDTYMEDVGSHTVSLVATNDLDNYKRVDLSINIIPPHGAIGELIDPRDDQIYQTVMIGEKEWMSENLNYKTDSGSWVNEEYAHFGSYYNWETAKKVCPTGWHLPSDEEWAELRNEIKEEPYIKDGNVSFAQALASKYYWQKSDFSYEPGTNGLRNNASNFKALPAGGCGLDINGVTFYGVNRYAGFWSSTPSDNEEYARLRYITYDQSDFERFLTGEFNNEGSIYTGLSVRCVKD